MKNESVTKHTKHINQKHFVTLIIFLLPLLACALFAPDWIKAGRVMTEGEHLLEEKKYDKAIEKFSKAIALIENDDSRNKGNGKTLAQIFKLRGTAYFKLKNYDKSLEDFNKSIILNRNEVKSAYAERGKLFLVKKDYEKAFADFEKAKPAFSNDYRAALGKAIAYYETQKYEKADEFLSMALRDLRDLRNSQRQYNYDPDDHVKAYEYSIKLSEQKGDTKNAELK